MNQLALIENALSLDQVMAQRNLVMQIMRGAMHEDQHYGKIPGCGEKPTLLLPGAQVMATTFRLTPSYVIAQEEPAPGHRSYQVTCILKHGDIVVGEGIGFGSSMESKHRYRNSAPIVEDTGDPVPKSYWDNPDKRAATKNLSAGYGGANVGVKKFDGQWRIVIYKGGTEGKVENPNPVDVFNTVLKMTKKRAFVDAVITATACNDLFTQDLEDIRQNLEAVDAEFVKREESKDPVTPIDPQPEKKEEPVAKRPSKKDKPEHERRANAMDTFEKVLKENQLTEDTRRQLFWNTVADLLDCPSNPEEMSIKQLSDGYERIKEVLSTVETSLNTISTK